ncbi:hypothetical protein [Streptomyces sp. CS014]|uniref:hypothetical protein n=1 Tax=Streptomyces sp. CS014 TaxID=2162707 RepID=UPI000D5150CF|nr:hypothetical protein [Streptomyces sp. CS014]PVC80803.1 hypothetical protein DBP12_36950 [Streptomyces sp. CS014]
MGLAHSLIDGNATASQVADALHDQYGERLAHRYACLAVAQEGTQVVDHEVPKLIAYDIETGETYETRWSRLATLLGHPAPYWFPALRDRDAIAAWRPGAPPAVVPACHVINPTAALTAFAADEPDGSPAAALCLHLAREARHRDHETTTSNIADLRENQAKGGDGAHLTLGAVPADLLRPREETLPEAVRRAGWLAITERRDALAHRVARFIQRWDGGHDWHTGAQVSVKPDSCATAREWAERLVPTDPGQPPTVLEKELLDNTREGRTNILLHDPVTGAPALRRAVGTRNEDIITLALQRLPTTSPLAALTVSGETSWIRTKDNTLWFAPERTGWGVSWGYSGTGCHNLAQLLDALLEDISTPPVTPGAPQPPRGLFDLLRTTPQDGSTTYTRAQLLAARAG